ncbi:MAG: hypothetical protein ACKOYG_08615 [Ilumatobacteraceae bacterium]
MSTLPLLPATVAPRRIRRSTAARARRAALRRSHLRQAAASAVGIVATALAAGVAAIMLLTAAAIAEGGQPQPARTGAVVEAPAVEAIGIALP